MNNTLSDFTAPLKLFRIQPLQVVAWIIVAIFFGLAGFWLPLLLFYLRDGSNLEYFNGYIKSNNLASFCIVILADGVTTIIGVIKGGKNSTTAGIRQIVVVFALILLMLSVAILMFPNKDEISAGIIWMQAIITSFAVTTAIYMYCMKSPDWEESVGDKKEEEDAEVEQLGKAASSKTSDEKGVRL